LKGQFLVTQTPNWHQLVGTGTRTRPWKNRFAKSWKNIFENRVRIYIYIYNLIELYN
jgi:hypothetical protein